MENLYIKLISIALWCDIEHPEIHMKNKCAIISKKIVLSRIMSLRPCYKGWVKVGFTEYGSGEVTESRRKRFFHSNGWKQQSRVHLENCTSSLIIACKVDLVLFKSSVQISVDLYFFLQNLLHYDWLGAILISCFLEWSWSLPLFRDPPTTSVKKKKKKKSTVF